MEESSEQLPREIAGYAVLEELAAGQTYLAMAPGQRRLVLKLLDEDCLLEGHLHPSVRERLSRVRELAHPGLANLHGVERDRGAAYLVWEYVEGARLSDSAAGDTAAADLTPAQRRQLRLARELVLTVATLHARGIVHGAIHAGNIIVDGAGSMKLTHVSPYLYTEVDQDVAAIIETLLQLAEIAGGADSPLGRLAARAREDGATLEELHFRLNAAIELRPEEADANSVQDCDRRRRVFPLLAALTLCLAAVVAGRALWHYLGAVR